MSNHQLYSYRRCPYAMRARMALVQAKIQCDVYEINFKDKSAEMLAVSPKGTVPVLILSDGTVLDESLDIIKWALGQNDPDCWGINNFDLIAENDGVFKKALDRYKYPDRFPNEDCSKAREQGVAFLQKLNQRIRDKGQLCGINVTIVDIAIFPFVRQFAHVDKAWFDAQDLSAVQVWLANHIASDLFQKIFKKHENSQYKLI